MDTTKRARMAAVAATCVIAAMTAACAGDSAPSAATGTTPSGTQLHATEKEFSISLDKRSVPAGDIRVTVTNRGAIDHELVAFGTNLAPDKLPLADSDVDENGPGITHYDPEAEHIKPGTSKTITLHLAAGHYVLVCNVPGHYKGGMHTALTVS